MGRAAHAGRAVGQPAFGEAGPGEGDLAQAEPPRRSPAALALLSALWPGLGEWRAGRRRAAVASALPPLIALIAVVAWLWSPGRQSLEAILFQPLIAGTALVIILVLMVLRLASMARAWRLGSREAVIGARARADNAGRLAVVLAAVVVVLAHLYLARFPVAFLQAESRIFVPRPTAVAVLPTATSTLAPGQTPGPTAPPTTAPSPTPTQPLPTDRVTILFIGIDLGDVTLGEAGLTDTILLASYDPVANKVDMISIPRDTALFPLYDDPATLFPDKINALKRVADADPATYPLGGTDALVQEIQYLVGVRIDYYASVEIDGLLQIFEAIGGLDVVNETTIDDPGYEFGGGVNGFHLDPGPQHLDPVHAMAYLRSRHGTGNSDFQRARRQQQVLLLLRDKLHDPQLMLQLPDLLPLVANVVRTDLPTDQFDRAMDLASASEDAIVKSVVLGPSTYATLIPPEQIGGQSAFRMNLDAVAALSVRLFGPASRYWDPNHPLPSESPDASPTASP